MIKRLELTRSTTAIIGDHYTTNSKHVNSKVGQCLKMGIIGSVVGVIVPLSSP